MKSFISIICLLLFNSLISNDIYHLYSQVNPESTLENFQFYLKYQNHPKGKEAFKRALSLMQISNDFNLDHLSESEQKSLSSIALFKKYSSSISPQLSSILVYSLNHNTLESRNLWDYKDILNLPNEQIDIARLILSYEHRSAENKKELIRYHEAFLDISALQIKSMCTDPNDEIELFENLIQFIFLDSAFQFPSHSTYLEDISSYSWIASTIEQKKGVCLGLTTLITTLAQRLSLPIYPKTIPGHIFAQFFPFRSDQHINIETTCRGIHIPDQYYKGLYPSSQSFLPTNKDMLVLTLINSGSEQLQKRNFSKASEIYTEALAINSNHITAKECLAYCFAAEGKHSQAKKILQGLILESTPLLSIDLAEDILNDTITTESIQLLLSIKGKTNIELSNELEQFIIEFKQNPSSKSVTEAIISLSSSLSLNQQAEFYLNKLKQLSPKDRSSLFTIAQYCIKEFRYKEAWLWLNKLKQRYSNQLPKAILELEHRLAIITPKEILDSITTKQSD